MPTKNNVKRDPESLQPINNSEELSYGFYLKLLGLAAGSVVVTFGVTQYLLPWLGAQKREKRVLVSSSWRGGSTVTSTNDGKVVVTDRPSGTSGPRVDMHCLNATNLASLQASEDINSGGTGSARALSSTLLDNGNVLETWVSDMTTVWGRQVNTTGDKCIPVGTGPTQLATGTDISYSDVKATPGGYVTAFADATGINVQGYDNNNTPKGGFTMDGSGTPKLNNPMVECEPGPAPVTCTVVAQKGEVYTDNPIPIEATPFTVDNGGDIKETIASDGSRVPISATPVTPIKVDEGNNENFNPTVGYSNGKFDIYYNPLSRANTEKRTLDPQTAELGPVESVFNDGDIGGDGRIVIPLPPHASGDKSLVYTTHVNGTTNLFLQRKRADGSNIGLPAPFTNYTTGDLYDPSAAKLPNDAIVACHTGDPGGVNRVFCDVLGAPTIFINEFTGIIEGINVTLSNANLSATDIDNTSNRLTYIFTNIKNGFFYNTRTGEMAGEGDTFTFTAADLSGGFIKQQQKGDESDMTHDIQACNDILCTPAVAANTKTIRVNDRPIVETNPIPLVGEEPEKLDERYFKATDAENNPMKVEVVESPHLKVVPASNPQQQNSLPEFGYGQVRNGGVLVQYDGNGGTPTNITLALSDGVVDDLGQLVRDIYTLPINYAPGNNNNTNTTTIIESDSTPVTVGGILGGTGVVAFILLAIAGGYKYQREKQFKKDNPFGFFVDKKLFVRPVHSEDKKLNENLFDKLTPELRVKMSLVVASISDKELEQLSQKVADALMEHVSSETNCYGSSTIKPGDIKDNHIASIIADLLSKSGQEQEVTDDFYTTIPLDDNQIGNMSGHPIHQGQPTPKTNDNSSRKSVGYQLLDFMTGTTTNNNTTGIDDDASLYDRVMTKLDDFVGDGEETRLDF